MLAEKPKRKRTTYSPATIAKAKALYIVKGLGPTEICARTDVPGETLSNWIARGKWVSERKARQLRLERNAVARASDENAAFLESMATQAEELAEDGMQLAREHVQSGSEFAARNFQSATQGVKNVVDVYFKARGLDGKGNAGSVVNIGSVYVNQAPIQREVKPVVDLGTVQLPEGNA